jgi:hypothetical protein
MSLEKIHNKDKKNHHPAGNNELLYLYLYLSCAHNDVHNPT